MSDPSALPQETSGQFLLEFDRPPLALLTPDDIFSRIDETLLRKLKEDSRLERKPSGQHAQSLGDYFSMWANTQPLGGLIAVGVKNDGTMEGCSNLSQPQINHLETTVDFCPDAVHKIKRVLVHRDSDGVSDFVLLFRIHYHQTKVVKTVGGKIFVRRGDSKRELRTTDEIRQLQEEKGEIQFEAEPCNLVFPRDFAMDSIAEFVAAVRSKKGWDDTHSMEDILQLMHLGKVEGGRFLPNYACAMVFATDPRTAVPGCRIRFLRFEGTTEGTGEKWNAVKDEMIDGPIPKLLSDTESLMKSQLRTFSRLGTGGKFFTSTEYPEFAWYEAIVNACAHRAYCNGMKNTPIFIRMFHDRLEIESPGPFPPFITQENIYQLHIARNPFLMEAMYFMRFVKMAHEGTRRMKQLMLDYELPAPEFKQDEVGHALVRVTLRNNIKSRRQWVDADVVALLGAQIAHSLSPKEKRVINFCAEYGKINVTDAVRLIGGEWGTMKKLLESLVDKNILERRHNSEIQRDAKSHYVLRGMNIPSA